MKREYKSEYVKNWRSRTKQRMVEAMGGCCAVCGYNKCIAALAFHHLKGKDFSFSSKMANPIKWSTLVKEMRKCVLLCCRCHAELHAGVIVLPDNVERFDEAFANYEPLKPLRTNACPICGKQKPLRYKSCSTKCAAVLRQKINWDDVDLAVMLEHLQSYFAVGKALGLSHGAVIRRAKKLGLYEYHGQGFRQN